MNANDIQKISSIDLYEILDVANDCSTSRIKKSYKKLVLRVHPDKSGGESEEFELVNLSYTVLKDEKLRKLYDKERKLYLESRDFSSLKKDSSDVDFGDKFPDNKEDAEILFKKLDNDFNIKHKFNKDDIGALNTSEVSNRLQKLQFSRTKDDDDFKEQFKKLNVGKSEFNDVFLNRNERDVENITEIIAFNNDDGALTNYSSINENNLYSTNGTSSVWYTSFDSAFKSQIPNNVTNAYNSHNVITQEDKQRIKSEYAFYKNNIR